MNLGKSLVAVLLLFGLSVSSARAADKRPVVAVFDVQTKFLKISKAKREMLTELLGQMLGVGGVYQIMPPGDVKKALLEQSSESFKKCFDEKCQIELGRNLPANKMVTTTILKAAGACRVTSSLYDLKRQTTDIVATEKGACNEAGYVDAIEKVSAKLREWGGGTTSNVVLPTEDGDADSISPSADKEYKRALNGAWRKLAKAVRRGTTEQKLENYQEFLTDFPTDNPHTAKVQKNIDILEAKLERQEKSKRRADEKKSALEAKRQRAKELKAAYNEAKVTKGRVSKQLKVWEQFVADYPDDNPYMKTAQRMIRNLKQKAEKEDVKQPGTNLYWMRCPLGQIWTGSSCQGKANTITWEKAPKACPDGYRLPTRQEFMLLLGGCDSNLKKGKTGYCSSCEKSGTCRSMFGKDIRSMYMWSNGYAVFHDGYIAVNAKAGFQIICVRVGP
ncbi:MAG: hypothetical protein JRJ87_25895 [Deltaproteobacteria bacterium]|nr:hypothetical protein [Deltaproteobacteria bacterium]